MTKGEEGTIFMDESDRFCARNETPAAFIVTYTVQARVRNDRCFVFRSPILSIRGRQGDGDNSDGDTDEDVKFIEIQILR